MNESQVFANALKLASPAERAAYLDAACVSNPRLRADVEALLLAHASDPDFLEQPAGSLGGTVDVPPAGGTPNEASPETGGTEQAGAVLAGRYKLLEEIGEGGMGTVWMAQQTAPVKRPVAVKLIKAGMGSKAVLARFEAERQALALMDHPNIAKVFDAGVAPDGRPFFVMELVKGVPLTTFCDQQKLPPRQRLELLVPVCQAVQHAHQKGVIHRDLKPSNVLVALYDDRPMSKVIDFGVAKATGQSLTEQTLQTGFGAVVGTVEYMSPEQASFNQLDADTRSDIYSLGVLLYELLTGTTPLEHKRLKEAALLEVLRLIREEEPPRPSTRLSTAEGLATIAANRGLEPKKLSGLVRGELDWIVMKALEKDRTRRYETANGLARDIERHLDDEAVEAGPPSAWYRLKKSVRRHRTALSMAVVVVLALLLIIGGMGWVLRDRAERWTKAAEALDQADTFLHQEKWAECRAASERAGGLLAGMAGYPQLQERLGRIQADLSMVTRLDEARLKHAASKDDHFDGARSVRAMAAAFQEHDLPVLDMEPLEAAERIASSDIREALLAALVHWSNNTADPAERKRLGEVLRRADPDSWRQQLFAAVDHNDWGGLLGLARQPESLKQPPVRLVALADLLARKDMPAAVVLLRQAQRRHPDDFWINQVLGLYLRELRQSGEAVGFFRAALALRPQSPGAHYNLGAALKAQGQHAEAESEFRQAICLQPDGVLAHIILGDVLSLLGKGAEAETECRLAIRLRPNDAKAHYGLGIVLIRSGKRAEAETECRQAIRLRPHYAEAHNNLGVVLRDLGKPAESAAAFRQAIRLEPNFPPPHHNLGIYLREQGRFAEAESEFRQSVRLEPENADGYFGLGTVLYDQNKFPEAATAFRQAIRLQPDNALLHDWLGFLLARQSDLDGAIAAFRMAIFLKPGYAKAHDNLGNVLRRKGALDGAIASYRAALQTEPGFAEARAHLQDALKEKQQRDAQPKVPAEKRAEAAKK